MALNDCIEKALKARKITDKQVQDINRMVEQEQLSEQEVLERFIQKAKEAKRRVQLQAIATKKNLDLINSHPGSAICFWPYAGGTISTQVAFKRRIN